jgi:hypothetical protein
MTTSLPPFGQPGHWLKGNLHTHTTQSDGKLTPLENVQWHADHGYNFVALTDHNHSTDPTVWVPKSPILAIPSIEITAHRASVEYHVLAIGVNSMPIVQNSDPQATIDAITAVGGLSIVAHPYWHDHSIEDLLTLHGHTGIEIFNTGCWLEINKGHSLVHWDAVLRRGQRIFGFANDDSHWFYPDYGRGWVMVCASRPDQPAILEAIRKGHFYSTMGPEIYDIQLDGRQVTVHCSPARSIFLIGDYHHCPAAAQTWGGNPLTEATFTLDPQQEYLRVEVVDMEYQSAWTQAYFINKETKSKQKANQ